MVLNVVFSHQLLQSQREVKAEFTFVGFTLVCFQSGGAAARLSWATEALTIGG